MTARPIQPVAALFVSLLLLGCHAGGTGAAVSGSDVVDATTSDAAAASDAAPQLSWVVGLRECQTGLPFGPSQQGELPDEVVVDTAVELTPRPARPRGSRCAWA